MASVGIRSSEIMRFSRKVRAAKEKRDPRSKTLSGSR